MNGLVTRIRFDEALRTCATRPSRAIWDLVMATGCDELRRPYDAARVRARKQPDETWKREPHLPQATCPRVAPHSQSPRSPQEIRLKSVIHRPFASREVFHGFLEESH